MDRYTILCNQIEDALAEKPKRTALYNAMKRGRDSRRAALENLPGGESFRKDVREIKERCLGNQNELVERFAKKVEERGAEVFLAQDGAAAIAYILEIAIAKIKGPFIASARKSSISV